MLVEVFLIMAGAGFLLKMGCNQGRLNKIGVYKIFHIF